MPVEAVAFKTYPIENLRHPKTQIMMCLRELTNLQSTLLSKPYFKFQCNCLAMLKRNRVASLLMLPFAVFTWMIGWIMCEAGEKKVTLQNKKPQNRMI
ncbi:MAG: hypothetical protein ABSF44_11390 [Candidatus Bathyarchaeia archaeon]